MAIVFGSAHSGEGTDRKDLKFAPISQENGPTLVIEDLINAVALCGIDGYPQCECNAPWNGKCPPQPTYNQKTPIIVSAVTPGTVRAFGHTFALEDAICLGVFTPLLR